MFSLGKILIIALVALAAYLAYRRFSAPKQAPVPRPATPPPASSGGGGSATDAEDLIRCPVCGVYAARGSGRCSRPSCPGV